MKYQLQDYSEIDDLQYCHRILNSRNSCLGWGMCTQCPIHIPCRNRLRQGQVENSELVRHTKKIAKDYICEKL